MRFNMFVPWVICEIQWFMPIISLPIGSRELSLPEFWQ